MTAMAHAGVSRRCRLGAMSGSMVTLVMPRCKKKPRWPRYLRRNGSYVTLPRKSGKKAAIVAAGPIANFVLAIVIFSGVFYLHGRAILLPVVEGVAADSAAEAAGFQPEDRIVSI
jgi:Peptidase family M50